MLYQLSHYRIVFFLQRYTFYLNTGQERQNFLGTCGSFSRLVCPEDAFSCTKVPLPYCASGSVGAGLTAVTVRMP